MRWAHSAVDYLAAAVGGDRGGGAVVQEREMVEVGVVGQSLEREWERSTHSSSHTVLHTQPPPPTHTAPPTTHKYTEVNVKPDEEHTNSNVGTTTLVFSIGGTLG